MKPYKTPTEDAAIGRETKREKLRKRYKVREGDVIRMALRCGEDSESNKAKTRLVRMRVVDMNEHNVTLRHPYPGDYNESFSWWEFEKRRRD